MSSFPARRFVGVVIGVAVVIWGVAHHSVLIEAIGCVVAAVGVVRTIAALRGRR
jgi:hypothetical protein